MTAVHRVTSSWHRSGLAAHPSNSVNVTVPVALLIDGAPQPTLLALNRDDDLVQIPHVTVARWFPLQAVRVVRFQI